MSRAQLVSLAIFIAWEATALVVLAHFGGVAFAFVSMAGCIASAMVFTALASPEERRRDLEDRVRNPPL